MLAQFKKLTDVIRTVFIGLTAISLAYIFINIYQVLVSSNDDVISPKNTTITSKYSYLIDELSKHSVQDVLANKYSFIKTQPDQIPYELGTQTYWIKIAITNNAEQNQNLILHADNTMLTSLDIYELTNEKSATNVFSLINGSYTSKLPLLISPQVFPHLNVELLATQSKQYLVRLNTMGPPNVPLILYKKASFLKRVQMTELIFGAFIGIILLMATYNFVLYFAIRDKVYLVYIGYLLSAFTVLASVNGYGYLIFSTDVQQWLVSYSITFHFLLSIFLLLFALYFLRYDAAKNITYNLGLLLCLLLIVCSLGTPFFDQILQAKIFFSLQPLVYLYAIFIIFSRIKKDFSWARFYFISWLPLLTGAAIQPLMLLNYIEYSFYARQAFLLGVLAEIIFMAFALAERMRRHEQDRLDEIGYHKATELPRKLMLENAIEDLIQRHTKKFSVIVINPEQLARISLYIDHTVTIDLFKKISKHLKSLFAHNDAIVSLTNNHEKICFLESNSFAVLLDHKLNHQPIQVLINSIFQITRENYQLDQLTLPLAGVIGVANFPEHGETANTLLNRAQSALKNAENTHEKWAYYAGDLSDRQPYYLKLATDMIKALAQNDFEIYHQPQIDLKTLRVCGSECLIRWQHETEGYIRPSIFIPIAEDFGLINQITLWVIKQALLQHQEIIENGHKNHMISINISAKDTSNDQFYHQIVQIIEQSDIKPEKIIFELKESASTKLSEQDIEVLNKLSDLGITISIDDFGTGISSMSYISSLPFSELKVDGEFVENVCDSVKRRTICETTIKMAKGLGLEVVAEGISSALDERTLQNFGCDIGQGHYYAEAMPIEQYLTWLNEQTNGQNKNISMGEFIPAKSPDKEL